MKSLIIFLMLICSTSAYCTCGPLSDPPPVNPYNGPGPGGGGGGGGEGKNHFYHNDYLALAEYLLLPSSAHAAFTVGYDASIMPGLVAVRDSFVCRAYQFMDEMRTTSLFGMSNQLTNINLSNSDPYIEIDGGSTFGLQYVDFSEWNVDIFYIIRAFLLASISFCSLRIIIKA